MALKEPTTLKMEINHRKYSFPEGVSVLRAAELNDIYIPSLCSHKDLSPFGGCRMCMVEIEGMRGYPLACNTMGQEGLKVLTDTVMLKELRREILKLILSEHPASCLICDESQACKDYQGTIRKAGVTTGCRFCPNDLECELQDVVEALEITDIDYPIYYHGYEAEHEDPFYDRDYNICILCGRCVRMCQEVRGNGVLAFTYRGPKAKIGPAFGRTHVEAGCEFCGACVDVCPTGALADKASKWDGKPDGTLVSTCPFCSLGCQVELYYKNGRLSKIKANLDPEINDGQLCVRGRFCMPEMTHHFERAKRPMLQKGKYFREVAWEEALETVGGKLKGIKPGEFLMLVSPDLTNESLFAAQKFVRECLGCNGIDSTARISMGGGIGLWSQLFTMPVSIKDIEKSDAILAVGLDSRFDFSVVGVQVRRALDRGAKLVTIDARDSNLARYTDDWLQANPGTEGQLLKAVAGFIADGKVSFTGAANKASVDKDRLKQAAQTLASADDVTVIVGPQVFHYGDNKALVDGLFSLSGHKNINIIPLYFDANARGAIEMGVFPEMLPGGEPAKGGGLKLADVQEGKKRPKVVYLGGEVPLFKRPDCDFLIAQDNYLPPFAVDAFLPASSYAESGGTTINVEGRVQEVVQVEFPPEGAVTGFAHPDWRIFSDLAKQLESDKLHYRNAKNVLKDIRKTVPGFPTRINRKPRTLPGIEHLKPDRSIKTVSGNGGFLLVAAPAGYRYRGTDISSKVGGLGELALEEGFRIHPDDFDKLKLKDGGKVRISWENGTGKGKVTGLAKSDRECRKGVVYYTRPVTFGGLGHLKEFEPLYRLRENPIPIKITAVRGKGGKHV